MVLNTAQSKAPPNSRKPTPGSVAWAQGLQGKQKGQFDAWTKAMADRTRLKQAGIPAGREDDFSAWISKANGYIKPEGPGLAELAQWQQRRDWADRAYAGGLAQNEFERGQAEQGYVQAREGFDRGFGRARERMPYEANAAGGLTSGVYRRGLSDLQGERARGLLDLLAQRAGALQGLDLADQGLESARTDELARIAQEEAFRRMMLGSRLAGG